MNPGHRFQGEPCCYLPDKAPGTACFTVSENIDNLKKKTVSKDMTDNDETEAPGLKH